MLVNFYVFSKKYNSTLRPTSDLTPQGYDCVLKSPSSVISPTIELNYGLVLNPSQYNYCYIQVYDRYYWITEWTYSNSSWIASLSVDVLATWRPYIGNTDMYVYRSSYEYNPKVPDAKYPTTGDTTTVKTSIEIPTTSLKDGYYIVSIYGVQNASDKTVSYYAFSSSNFAIFINKLYASLSDDGLFGVLWNGVRNSIFHISDFIASCKWSPYNPSANTEVTTQIAIGNIILNGFNCYRMAMTPNGYSYKRELYFGLIPKHPQSSTRGSCYNLKPYTEYKLTCLPFGSFLLDTTKMQDRTHLSITNTVDGISGQGILTVKAFNYVNNVISDEIVVAIKITKYLIDIPLIYSNTDIFGVMQNATYEAINQTYASKIATAPLTTIHAINAFTDLIGMSAEVDGTQGGLALIGYEENSLLSIFYGIADEDNDSNGRPLLKVRKPMNIPGYIEGESHNFKAPATESEQVEVRNFIDRGFYYE